MTIADIRETQFAIDALIQSITSYPLYNQHDAYDRKNSTPTLDQDNVCSVAFVANDKSLQSSGEQNPSVAMFDGVEKQSRAMLSLHSRGWTESADFLTSMFDYMMVSGDLKLMSASSSPQPSVKRLRNRSKDSFKSIWQPCEEQKKWNRKVDSFFGPLTELIDEIVGSQSEGPEMRAAKSESLRESKIAHKYVIVQYNNESVQIQSGHSDDEVETREFEHESTPICDELAEVPEPFYQNQLSNEEKDESSWNGWISAGCAFLTQLVH